MADMPIIHKNTLNARGWRQIVLYVRWARSRNGAEWFGAARLSVSIGGEIGVVEKRQAKISTQACRLSTHLLLV
jgi:hypothetical protein